MRRIVAALAVCASFAACSEVKPWQRETLSHRCMTEERRAEEARARQHMLGARETTAGATGQTGGGCGCK